MVKNADLTKSALSKLINTHEWCKKYNFVTPLTLFMDFMLKEA